MQLGSLNGVEALQISMSSSMSKQINIDWHARAATLQIRNQAFIDGRYVDAAAGARFDCISPVDGRVLTQVAACAAVDVDNAVAAARKTFEQGSWSHAE